MTNPSTSRSPEARRVDIVGILESQGEKSIDDLADYYGVSSMTIRRDLQELSDRGKVMRTHGGALAARRVSFEFRFLERSQEQAAEKEQIARVAASLVRPGDSVLLDSGTTTLTIARQLALIQPLTIVTTSLPIASELYAREGIELLLLGGVLRSESPDLTGALTDMNLDHIRADVAFIGADAIDMEGHIYNQSPQIGRMLSRMASRAERAYAAADHTKFGSHALLRFGSLRDWQGVLTDDQLAPEIVADLRALGINIVQESTA